MKKDKIGIMPRSFVFKSPDFPLGVKKITEQTEYAYHIHEDYCELVVIGRGHATHIIDGMKYAVGPGDVFVIQEGRVHAYADIHDIEICNILFDWKKLNFPIYDLDTCPGFQFLFKIDLKATEKDRFDKRFRLNTSQLTVTMELINALDRTISEDQTGCQFNAVTIFHQLIQSLIMNYSNTDSNVVRNTIPHLLGILTSSMEKDCSQNLSVEEMCRRTNMSRANLFRHFRKSFQESPLSYLQNIRIEHASKLLMNSGLSISEIACRTGFSDSSYFARRFRTATGFTPYEFRNHFNKS